MHWNDKVLIFTKILKDIQLYLAEEAATDSFIDFFSPTAIKLQPFFSKPIIHYKRTVLQLIQFLGQGTGNTITWTGCGLVS